MRLENKVAIVTGAGGAIGSAIASLLAEEGASVIVDDLFLEGAKRTAAEIRAAGGKAIAVQTDISQEDQVAEAVETAIREFGQIDILVNNAAVTSNCGAKSMDFVDSTPENWALEINTDLYGTLYFCHKVLPHMIKQRSGKLINISSNSGKSGQAKSVIYSGCKAAIAGLSRALAKNVGPYNINVNCISPGCILTPSTKRWQENNPETAKALTMAQPMRKWGEPRDIAEMVLFLASDSGNFITGQNYGVDGGEYMSM